ncbi:GrpB family protein [Nocardioides sp. MAHUQ-72]|uniref:GrpB family protein n=1 Tax=unclassified Nocardioides TaxID=2615069 RepID=UPI003614C344
MHVTVTDYDPRWAADFERIRADLLAALDGVDVLAVEHVGSTAVPGLPAKPVIDVDVVVPEEALPAALDAVAGAGYAYEGEKGVEGRHAFRAPDDGTARHVYVCVDGCVALRNHLLVRDVLRADPSLRQAYADVKAGLAARDLPDMEAYVAGKNAVLQQILAAAGLSPDELDQVAGHNPTA